jgi:hypothetical protein
MNISEVEERFNKSIAALKSLEQILKNQEESYDVHITRLGWLKHLLDACSDLKRYEVESIRSAQIAAQYAQQQAQRESQLKAAEAASAAPPVTPPVATPAVAPVSDPETSKKTKRKSE